MSSSNILDANIPTAAQSRDNMAPFVDRAVAA